MESSLYRAVWRWHFYAGLLVLPVLALLAVTGAIYLFQPELDRLIYREYMEVPARSAPAAPVSVVMHNMEAGLNGRVVQLVLPAGANGSIMGLVRVASGEVQSVYADPYDGRVLGSTPFGGVMQTVRKVHSLQLFGFWASSIVEVAAGWAIILVLSGVFLWWPRGRSGGVITVRETPKKRVFWRDLHAVTGVMSGAVIVFLALTGMPWSMFWGSKVQTWAAVSGLGAPAAPAQVTPGFLLSVTRPDLPNAPRPHHETAHTTTTEMPRMVPWALERSAVPQSQVTGTDNAADIGIDSAIARFTRLGVARPMGVQLPEGARGAYTATHTPGQTDAARTVYLDQYTGAVLGDVGFAEYGPVAKAVEWGIAVHTGQEYGWVNRLVMLAGCIAILLLTISAPVMWWKRRPKGTLGAPPMPTDRRASYVVTVLVVVVGIIFPLVGASLLCALLVDLATRQLRSRSVA